jgi:UMF1 family MFS transporter
MASALRQKRVFGWMMFDWASQPFNTLLLTFIFGPYFAATLSDAFMAGGLDEATADANTQSVWSLGQSVSGLIIAFSAPFLGAMADTSGRRMPWIYVFSALYVVGSFALWWAYPDASNHWWMLIFFSIGLIGMEFATIFTNALLPGLAPREDIGRISGSGFAFGYWGGVVALFMVMLLFAEDATTGKTFLGIDPLFGLDASQREGTRVVGPFTAIWYIVFMVIFFVWVKEAPSVKSSTDTVRTALSRLVATIRSLKVRKSLAAFLGSSLLYRDALNGLYAFGGVYATLVLNWSIMFIGIFGIIAAITAAIFSWAGGIADHKFGPKPVIIVCITILVVVCTTIVGMSRTSFFGIPLVDGSSMPDIAFFICGGAIGAAGGALQASSRTLMVWHADPDRATEAFGLYALSGKATAFLAPALIGIATYVSNSPRIGISPLIGLFVLSLIVFIWVKPGGEEKPS